MDPVLLTDPITNRIQAGTTLVASLYLLLISNTNTREMLECTPSITQACITLQRAKGSLSPG
jgi:hypothetical protein